MRRTARTALAALAGLALSLSTATLGVADENAGTTPPPPPTLLQCKSIVKHQLYVAGKLTVATDNPVYAPWFIKDTPSNRQGYESALAYALAARLGIDGRNVRWVTEPFATSYAAGSKPFDFDINEIVRTPARAKNVSMSASYYNVQQSLVAMKSDLIVRKHSPLQLKGYRYGTLAHSPAYGYVTTRIKPTYLTRTFADISSMQTALESGSIDAIAIDTPTGYWLVNFQIQDSGGIPLATQVGQFPALGDEYYSMVLQKHNPLLTCLNVALSSEKNSGALHALAKKWLTIYQAVPVLRP